MRAKNAFRWLIRAAASGIYFRSKTVQTYCFDRVLAAFKLENQLKWRYVSRCLTFLRMPSFSANASYLLTDYPPVGDQTSFSVACSIAGAFTAGLRSRDPGQHSFLPCAAAAVLMNAAAPLGSSVLIFDIRSCQSVRCSVNSIGWKLRSASTASTGTHRCNKRLQTFFYKKIKNAFLTFFYSLNVFNR